MTDEPLPGIHPGRVLFARGQRWLTENDVETCGYVGYVGEVVRVQPSPGVIGDRFYELAALMSPARVGIAGHARVWWLRLMCSVPDCGNPARRKALCLDHVVAAEEDVKAVLGTTDERR